jgi:hypothetical protein
VTASVLGAIPVIDARDGGPRQVARVAEQRMPDLFRQARRTFNRPGLAFMDSVSRRWLDRSSNPYRSDVEDSRGAARKTRGVRAQHEL